jgi:lipopolysaccharide export LptBFGC system permease protein LptF
MYSLIQLTNRIRSEMHARASFSLSCLILVMIGAALGMMFKSGNYLTAFAISVFPAILTIVLIVSGQNIAEEVPRKLVQLADPLTNAMNPLHTGLAVIWAGNIVVLIIATVLLWRLHRQ